MNQAALLNVDNVPAISKKVYPWKFRARVLALWNVPEHLLPFSSSSIDMVLIDQEVKWVFILLKLKCNTSWIFRPICYV